MNKLVELHPGDLFNFKYDYPGRYALCLASYQHVETKLWTCTFLHYTDHLAGVITLELNPFCNVEVHHR